MKSKLSFSERLRVFTKPLPSNEKGCWACTVVPASKRATLDKHRQTQKSHVNLIASQFAHVDAYLSYYMASYKLIINECLRLQQHYPANRPARASLEVSIESRTINLNHKPDARVWILKVMWTCLQLSRSSSFQATDWSLVPRDAARNVKSIWTFVWFHWQVMRRKQN